MAIRTLGSRYLLDEQIGQGGMGVVWRGRDKVVGTEYAIKVLRQEYAADADAVTRFVRERTVLMKFRHPGVVSVHDMIVEGDQLALVMDLVLGGDLNGYQRRSGGTLPAAEAARIGALICDGLAAAHAAGIVHRDLKPANVLLDNDQVRLADFGVARIIGEQSATTTGTVLGTAAYLAPELLTGSQPSPACDIYALGITLYEVLGGEPPFGGHVAAIMHHHLETAPARIPGVPEPLWELVSACLAKKPERRPTAEALASSLRAPALLGVLASVTPTSTRRDSLAAPSPVALATPPPGSPDLATITSLQPASPVSPFPAGFDPVPGAPPPPGNAPTRNLAGPGTAGPAQAGPRHAGPGRAGPGQAGPGQAGPGGQPAGPRPDGRPVPPSGRPPLPGGPQSQARPSGTALPPRTGGPPTPGPQPGWGVGQPGAANQSGSANRPGMANRPGTTSQPGPMPWPGPMNRPGPGQPGYGQPASGQPGMGQPGVGQQGIRQSATGQPGVASESAARSRQHRLSRTKKKQRRPSPVMLGAGGVAAVLVVLLVAALIAHLGPFSSGHEAQAGASTPPSKARTGPSSPAKGHPSPAHVTKATPLGKAKCGSTVEVPYGPSLLVDGDFGQATLQPWNVVVQDAVIDPGKGIDNQNAIRLAPAPQAAVAQTVAGLVPRTCYEVTGWAHTGGTKIGIGALDPSDDKINDHQLSTAKTWTRLSAVYLVPAGQHSAEIYCIMAWGGTGYCSDLTFRVMHRS